MPNQNNPQKPVNRLLFLDGLRGLAVLLVVIYHAYSDWPELHPYKDAYSETFLHLEYAVQLFFMISGFVIAMTLEKCKGFGEFIVRRWLRLFPAMLITIILIFLTAPLLSARPSGLPLLQNALPGLLFIEPKILNFIFSSNLSSIEIPFWTLYVEAKFYLIAGLLYFTFGLKRMIFALVILFFCSVAFVQTSQYLPVAVAQYATVFFELSDFRHFGWFATGALFYCFFTYKVKLYMLAAIGVGLFSARSLDGVMSPDMLFGILIVSLFAFAIVNSTLQKILSNQFMVWMGFISYPLYLIHDGAMVSMIHQLHAVANWMPGYLLPVLPIIWLIFVAWIIAKYVEPNLRHIIKRFFTNKIAYTSS